MGTIVLTLATCALVACSSNDSSSSSPEENPAEDSSESSSDPRSDKNSSGVVVLDSLGRPLSSSGVSQGGSSTGLSSSSVGPVIGIEDTVITDTTVVTDVNALPDCSAEIEGESFLVQSENILYFCLGGDWVEAEMVAQVSQVGCRNGVLTVGDDSEDETSGSERHPPTLLTSYTK